MPRFVTIALLVALTGVPLAPLPALADAFYVCTKKGAVPAWVNEPMVKTRRKQGWRCRKRMHFQNDGSSRTDRERSSSGGSVGSGAPKSATSVRSPSRFHGPAGSRESFEPYIREASERYNVPANLVRAVIRVESNFHPNAVSSAGAKGLMQLMPGTAKEMGVSDLFDPRQNILGGVRYLRVLINAFEGDPRLALAAYHAGPGIVKARGGIPYAATEGYVRTVLSHYLRYKQSRL